MNKIGLAALAVLMAAGCAGDEPPPAALAQAETAIQMARQADAATLAPLPLRVAEDRLAAAVAAAEDDDDETAAMLAEQARVNAQVAQAQAGAARTQQATRELQSGVEAMRRGAGEGQTAEAPLTAPGAIAPAIPPR